MELRKVIKDILKENQGIQPKDLKERNFDINILLGKKSNKINTFTGFRRVGKTYLLFLIMKNLKDESCIYFNFEDETSFSKNGVEEMMEQICNFLTASKLVFEHERYF